MGRGRGARMHAQVGRIRVLHTVRACGAVRTLLHGPLGMHFDLTGPRGAYIQVHYILRRVACCFLNATAGGQLRSFGKLPYVCHTVVYCLADYHSTLCHTLVSAAVVSLFN